MCVEVRARATVRGRVCVLISAQCVKSLHSNAPSLVHTHFLPLWMPENDGLAGLSWLLYIVNIFKKLANKGRDHVLSDQLQGSRSRWRVVRMRKEVGL